MSSIVLASILSPLEDALHGLLFGIQRHTGLPSSRTHDGKIIVLASNLRWCSDHLELHAHNGEVVRVLFVIDACDREIIAWSAVANAGISGPFSPIEGTRYAAGVHADNSYMRLSKAIDLTSEGLGLAVTGGFAFMLSEFLEQLP